jgi:hypothetical protein
MCLQKVICKKNLERKKITDVLKVTDENSGSGSASGSGESDVGIRGPRSTPKISWIRNTLVPGVLAAGQEDGQTFLLGQNGLHLPFPASEHQVCGTSSVRQLGENRLNQVHSSLFLAGLRILIHLIWIQYGSGSGS